MSDGTRVQGARAKGKAAAEKQAKSGKAQTNPYSNARPGMQEAWQQAFDEELSGKAAPAKPAKPKGKPGRKPKVEAPEPEPVDDDPVTVDEPIETMPADDAEPEFVEIGDKPRD
jgi:hypothetical protein